MSYHNRKRGFTLVEMILAIAIVGVVSMLVAPIMFTTVKQYKLTSDRRGMITQARLAMDRMTYDIRLIPSTNDIITFTASNFVFNTTAENNVNYQLSGNNLQRSGSILADNVTSLTFQYLDAAGNPTATKANIVRISFQITVNAGGTSGSLTLRNQVFPRRFTNAYNSYQ